MGATGDAGKVAVLVTGDVSILGGGVILANTLSSGAGGPITVHAHSLFIDGSANPNELTGISSNSGDFSLSDVATGAGGAIHIVLQKDLVSTGGGGIEAEAFSLGPGGNITIMAGQSVDISDGSFVASDAYLSGDGGW